MEGERTLKQRAFSLAEVLIALAVLAVGLLALAGAVARALRSEGRAGRATQALFAANRLAETSRLTRLPATQLLYESDSARVELNAPPFSGALAADPRFRRRVQTTRLSTDPSNYRFQLYQVDVTVFWFEQLGEEQVSISSLQRVP